jgi:tetratricopeptide (TPR) repeat protein
MTSSRPLVTEAIAWPPWRLLLLLGAGLVALAAIALGLWLWSESRALLAAEAYAGALARLHEPGGATPVTPETRAAALRDLELALQRYPASSMAAPAAYELGNARFAARDFPGARGAYEVALARTSAPTLRTLARVGVGYTWEAERNFERAAETFKAALDELKPGDFFFDQLLINLGRVQEAAGKKEDAVATYQRLLKDAPLSRRADDARARLTALGAKPAS